jgi:hypothetical protein
MQDKSSVVVNVNVVANTNPAITFSTLQNFHARLVYAQTFEEKISSLTALSELFTTDRTEMQPLIEMFIEAGLLSPILAII